jgi:23S rRNA-/tRNA-specific pseudouridylate synthase
MRLEHGFVDCSPCNRLDRLTSGVMMMGLNKTIAKDLHTQLTERTVGKQYYCRVAGKFPEGEIKVEKPLSVVSPKHGLNRLKENGKPSSTVFQRVFYDEKRDQSVVLATPLTGRTHQIRYAILRKRLTVGCIYNILDILSRMIRFMQIRTFLRRPRMLSPYPTKKLLRGWKGWGSLSLLQH